MRKSVYLRLSIAALAAYVLVSLLPVYSIAVSALKPVVEITVNPYGLPRQPTLSNFQMLLSWTYSTVGISFDAPPLLPAAAVTLSVAVVNVLVCVSLGLMAAFAVGRFRVGVPLLPFWVLSLLFAPPVIFAFPLYGMFRRLGLLDTTLGLIAANLTFNLPFAIWIFYGYLMGSPEDLEEAALIDGAGGWIIFWRILVPVMMPVVAAVGALIFVFTWNEYLFSLVLMNVRQTLTVALGSYNSGQLILYTSIAAGILLVVVPPILVLVFFGKYLATGLSFGAVK